MFKITKTTGKLIEDVHEGKNIWMSESEYKNLENVFASFDEMIEVVDSKKLIYLDRTKIVSSY